MDHVTETVGATIKFSDAHNILTDIGYKFDRQSGSSHKIYSKPNNKIIILSPHGKDISPASTREVRAALKVHNLRKLAEEIYKGNLVSAKELFEQLLEIKLQEKLEEKKKQFIFKESNGKFKYHINITQPHLAFEKNIKRRENLEKKLDSSIKNN